MLYVNIAASYSGTLVGDGGVLALAKVLVTNSTLLSLDLRGEHHVHHVDVCLYIVTQS